MILRTVLRAAATFSERCGVDQDPSAERTLVNDSQEKARVKKIEDVRETRGLDVDALEVEPVST